MIRFQPFFSIVLLIGVQGADWPHWRGPNRDGTTPEDSGWERGAWPPRELWRGNVGIGSTSPLVIAGKLYTMGWGEDADHVVCLDGETGKELWRVSYPCPRFGRNAVGDQRLYAGPTSTPEFDRDTGYLFTLSADGDLACWDTRQRGKKVWGLNLYDCYHMPKRPAVNTSGQRDYGYTTASLVIGDELLVEVGGDAGTVVAFDKRTGQQRWASEGKDMAGHTGGLVQMSVEDVPCLAVLTFNGLLVMRLEKGREGETVAHFPYQTEFANSITTPVVLDSEVLISSGYNHKAMTKLRIGLDGAGEVWRQERIVSKVCTPVLLNGRAYWSFVQMHCLDVASGQLLWKGRSGGSDGSCIITADERLIVWANRGELLLVETAERSPGECKILATVDRLFQTEVWPHVALAEGRLYCKDRAGNIACLSLLSEGGKAVTRSPTPGLRQPTQSRPRRAPGDGAGRVLEWVAGMGTVALGPAETATAALALKPRNSARIDAAGALVVSNGAFLVDDANALLLEQCRESGELTLEVMFQTDTLRQKGPARIVSFSADPYHRNFTLGQQDDRLVLRLRTPRTGTNGMKPETTVGKIRADTAHHIIVTYRDGELICYLDGQVTAQSDAVRGGFENWEPMHLLLGDEYEDNRDWKGTISRVAVLSRSIGPEEAKKRLEDARKGTVPAAGKPPAAPPSRTEPATAPGIPRSDLPTTELKLTELADWQGQASYRIDTPMGALVYHRSGAGFASLIDRDGQDWISFRPDGGAAGSYRGIPNLPIPESGFHPGATTCETRLVESTPDRVVIDSSTTDKSWTGRWTITRELAVLDLEKAPQPYWFLYEGTPGGEYDETKAWLMDSSGHREPCTARWERRLPTPRWICFGTQASPRVLFLVDLTRRPEEVTDSFWSMQKSMTVFGFGRSLSRDGGRWHHLSRTPARFCIGLVEATTHAEIARHIERVCRDLWR